MAFLTIKDVNKTFGSVEALKNVGFSIEKGEVVSVIFKGVHYEIMVRTENQDYKIHTTDLTEVGKKVDLDFWPEDIHVMEPMGTY